MTPAEVYQYGYFTHVAGVENVFGGTPNNASTAFFTFMNKLSTTRATPHGPLTVVDRKGTTTIYLNPAAGASFENPASFEAGTPVLTASLRHQVILDTLSGNTIFMQFDLTVMSAETFTVGDQSGGRPRHTCRGFYISDNSRSLASESRGHGRHGGDGIQEVQGIGLGS